VCVCVCVIRFDDVIRVLPPAPEVKRKQLMDLDDTKAQQVRSGGPVSPGGGGGLASGHPVPVASGHTCLPNCLPDSVIYTEVSACRCCDERYFCS
jgi:hypothetical protein